MSPFSKPRFPSAFGERILCTDDARLQAVIAGQHGDYALPPGRASVLMGSGLALHYLEGAYFPKGGGQMISVCLAEAIERQGGEDSPPGQGRADPHGGWTGQGRRDRQPTELPPSTTQRVREFEMAPALGMLYLGYERDLEAAGYPNTNYWIYPDYDYEPQYAAVRQGQFPAQPFAYVSIASLKDPSNSKLAPPGVTNMQVMSLAPHQPEAWGVTPVWATE